MTDPAALISTRLEHVAETAILVVHAPTYELDDASSVTPGRVYVRHRVVGDEHTVVVAVHVHGRRPTPAFVRYSNDPHGSELLVDDMPDWLRSVVTRHAPATVPYLSVRMPS